MARLARIEVFRASGIAAVHVMTRVDDLIRSIARVDHCVVLLGSTKNGEVLIGDPANADAGVVLWSQQQFADAWLGEGFYLTKG